jgi:hypothetical protein
MILFDFDSAPLYWVLASFGKRLDSFESQRRHERLQRSIAACGNSLARLDPLATPIRVKCWRFSRSEIPVDFVSRAAWLDDQWIRADRWASERVRQ